MRNTCPFSAEIWRTGGNVFPTGCLARLSPSLSACLSTKLTGSSNALSSPTETKRASFRNNGARSVARRKSYRVSFIFVRSVLSRFVVFCLARVAESLLFFSTSFVNFPLLWPGFYGSAAIVGRIAVVNRGSFVLRTSSLWIGEMGILR